MSKPIILISAEEYKTICGMKCHYSGYVYDPKGFLFNVESVRKMFAASAPNYPNEKNLWYTGGTIFRRTEYVTKLTIVDLEGYDFVFDSAGNFVQVKEEKDPARKGQIYIRRFKGSQNIAKQPTVEFFEDTKIQDIKNVLTPEAYSKIFTYIISLLMRDDLKMIRNKEISVITFPPFGGISNKHAYNLKYGKEKAQTRNTNAAYINYSKERLNDNIVMAVLEPDNRETMEQYSTIWNVLNLLGAHELIGHGVMDWWGDDYGTHYLTYGFQMVHSTWIHATGAYQTHIKERFYDLYNWSQYVEQINPGLKTHSILKEIDLYPHRPQQGMRDSLFFQNKVFPSIQDTSKMKKFGEHFKGLKIFPKGKK